MKAKRRAKQLTTQARIIGLVLEMPTHLISNTIAANHVSI